MQCILIIDDEEMVQEVLSEYLERKGYKVLAVGSGPLTLAHFPVFRPDLVLLDILMPGMNGIEVLEQIKHFNPHVCVIMLTAVADLTIAREAIQKGADNYLTKPIDFEQLGTCLAVHGLLHAED